MAGENSNIPEMAGENSNIPRRTFSIQRRRTFSIERNPFTPPEFHRVTPQPVSTSRDLESISETDLREYISNAKIPCADLVDGRRRDYFNICVPLYNASSRCDWAATNIILEKHPELVRFAITENYDTTLHVAVSAEVTQRTLDFVKNLVSMMSKEDLALRNKDSNTALCLASAAGNVKVVQIMLEKDPYLWLIPGLQGMSPLYLGALYGRHNLVKHLYDICREYDVWTLEEWGHLCIKCMESDIFDIALEIMVNKHEPKDEDELEMRIRLSSQDEHILRYDILKVLARKPDAFIGVKQSLIWRIINSISRIIHMKVATTEKDSDALQLLRFVWNKTITMMPKDNVLRMLRGPPTNLSDGEQVYSSQILFVAAEMGNTRFIVELLRAYPDLIRSVNDYNQTIFHIAIMHRHQDIHNLLYEIGSLKDLITAVKDKDGNNMLHLVGMTAKKMIPQTSGASLVMQRELLWFKEVENLVPPYYKQRKNNAGQTPYELFSENNKDLISDGLRWMGDCMVVATLIITVAFAVAFTVPGGFKQDKGFPVFIGESAFSVFVIANAISLLSSSTSLLVFLSIRTSRYGQRDFLYSLPRKLMIGLVTLFISVVAMMVTFSASSFVLYRNHFIWVPILIGIIAAIPVVGFAAMQFPSLVDMYRSMYDSRYLFKTRKYTLYNENL